jgi:hypothetical protein
VKQKQTNDYGMSREKLLKSEALLTLSLETHFSFEANSARGNACGVAPLET